MSDILTFVKVGGMNYPASSEAQEVYLRSLANGSASACGCECICHGDEGPDYPGPCAACCEPGDMCDHGEALEAAGMHRSILPTEHTRPDYVFAA